jgi:hypothetical protein
VPAIALLLALAAGCGDSNDPGDTPGATDDLGEMIRDEVEASLDALTLPSTLTPYGRSGGPCTTPSSTADGDGDGIPDDATYAFTAPPCRFSGIRGAGLDIVGQLRVEDPTELLGFAYDATLTGLRYTLVPDDDDDPDYTVTRNGFRNLSGSTAGLQLVTDLQAVRTFPGQSDGSVDEQWTVAFTPETQLVINQPLPTGSLEIDGNLGWTRGAESFALSVTTETPLHYDSACRSAQRFDAGELRAAGEFAGTPGYIRLRWSDCGQEPEISFVGE